MRRFSGLLFVLFCLVLTKDICAQRKRVLHLPEWDERWLHFGFGLGLNSSSFEMNHDPRKIGGDSLFSIEAIPQLGFNINMLASIHFLETCELRFFPGISFGSRDMIYKLSGPTAEPEISNILVESTNIEFPLFVKYRSERYNNFSAYMLAGGYYNLDLAAEDGTDNSKNAASEIVLLTKKHNYGFTVGLGTDFYMDFYKMALELRYNVGINNVFVQDGTFWARPIDILKKRMLTFTIIFEG